jgi:hypothetical protein
MCSLRRTARSSRWAFGSVGFGVASIPSTACYDPANILGFTRLQIENGIAAAVAGNGYCTFKGMEWTDGEEATESRLPPEASLAVANKKLYITDSIEQLSPPA